MNLFFDTSALVKLFHRETGSDAVETAVLNPENHIWMLSLCRIEFMSALYRRFRSGELNAQQLDEAKNSFDLQLRTFNEQPMTETVLREAEILFLQWGKSQGLRTLDALQLGAFSLLQEKDWMFVCADVKLAAIARNAGFRVLEPID